MLFSYEICFPLYLIRKCYEFVQLVTRELLNVLLLKFMPCQEASKNNSQSNKMIFYSLLPVSKKRHFFSFSQINIDVEVINCYWKSTYKK